VDADELHKQIGRQADYQRRNHDADRRKQHDRRFFVLEVVKIERLRAGEQHERQHPVQQHLVEVETVQDVRRLVPGAGNAEQAAR
jgi:hypothetical protein